MRIEDVDLTLSGSIHIRKRYLDCELGLFLLPWEWEVFKRRELGRLEACLGPFYIDLYWGVERDFDAEDYLDAKEALEGYTPGEGISVLETLERMREEGEL